MALRWQMAQHIFGNPGAVVRIFTERKQFFPAEETLPTGNREGRDDSVPDLKILDLASDFHYFAHESWPRMSPAFIVGMRPL